MFNREVRGRKGFSLIELLVTVTIMLLLVGVAAFYLEDYVYKSKVSKAQQDLDMFRSAVNMRDAIESKPFSTYNYADSSANTYFYKWNTDKVATFNADWTTIGAASAAWSNFATKSLSDLIGTYLKNVPKDPWGVPYVVNTAAGYIASTGTDMRTSTVGNTNGITEVGREKDIMAYYLGDKLVLTDAVVYDTNNSGAIDAGEYMDLKFNKDVQTVTAADLITGLRLSSEETVQGTLINGTTPAFSFSTVAKLKDNGRILRCVFGEAHAASEIIGKWMQVEAAATTGLGYSISTIFFDMDPYFVPNAGTATFGRPIVSTCNPARQVRFEIVW